MTNPSHSRYSISMADQDRKLSKAVIHASEKTCSKCGVTKPLQDYYRYRKDSDLHNKKCKECVKAAVTKRRNENLEKVREYDRLRNSMPHRIEARKRYASTEKGSHISKVARSTYIANNREKRLAHIILNNAIRDGLIVRPKACQQCWKICRPHGHHEDYTLPMDVMWLCVSCHTRRHNDMRSIMRIQNI